MNAEKAAHILAKTLSATWPTWGHIAHMLPIPFSKTEERHNAHEQGSGNGLGVVMMQYPLNLSSSYINSSEVNKVRRNDLWFYQMNWRKAGPPAGYSMFW